MPFTITKLLTTLKTAMSPYQHVYDTSVDNDNVVICFNNENILSTKWATLLPTLENCGEGREKSNASTTTKYRSSKLETSSEKNRSVYEQIFCNYLPFKINN